MMHRGRSKVRAGKGNPADMSDFVQARPQAYLDHLEAGRRWAAMLWRKK